MSSTLFMQTPNAFQGRATRGYRLVIKVTERTIVKVTGTRQSTEVDHALERDLCHEGKTIVH